MVVGELARCSTTDAFGENLERAPGGAWLSNLVSRSEAGGVAPEPITICMHRL